MNIYLITIGDKMPAWVTQAYQEYSKRLTAELKLVLIEVSAEIRSKNSDIERIKTREAEKLLAAIPDEVRHVIALEVHGKAWSSEQLAQQLRDKLNASQPIALLVGGPDGLAESCRQRADIQWSLSALTLPHPLVRVIIAEQIYRAYSILKNHPYHR